MTSSRELIDPAYQVPAFRAILRASKKAPTRGIQGYGVIRARPTRAEVVTPSGDPPHYHILLEPGGGQQFDAAVDIFDKDDAGGAEVLFFINPAFTPPDAAAWLALPTGATTIGNAGAGGLGIDYLRQNLVTRAQMSLLPVDPATIGSTLTGPVADLVDRAIDDDAADFFVFGKMFAAGGSGANPVFGFSPDAGIHDIHLNQGEAGETATYEDGAIFVRFPSDGHWEAAFFAFQTQSFSITH